MSGDGVKEEMRRKWEESKRKRGESDDWRNGREKTKRRGERWRCGGRDDKGSRK